MKKVEFDYDNWDKFEKFLNKLNFEDKVSLLETIDYIEDIGIAEAGKNSLVDSLGNGLYEIRARLGNNIQRAIYFHFKNNKYVITHGFTKKTQKTPKHEIDKANRIKKKY